MSGEILCGGTASLTNAAGATFNVQTPGGDFLSLSGFSNPTFTNAGVFNVQAGAGNVDTDAGLGFTNAGTVNVQSGTLDIVGAFNNEGTVNAQPGTLTGPGAPGRSNVGSATRPQVTEIVSASQNNKGLPGVTVVFDEALDGKVVNDRALFKVLGAVKKHHNTVYTRALRIKGISFDGQTRVTIKLAKPYKGAVKVTVLPGIPAADGAFSITNYSAVVN